MSWMDRLFLGKPWPAERIADLHVDVVTLQIAGLGHGDTQAIIEQRLGPPVDHAARRRGRLDYAPLGICIDVDELRRMSGFALLVGHPSTAPGSRALFPGRWEPQGSAEPPDEAGLIWLHGEPSSREVDDEDVMLVWEKDAGSIGADFDVHSGRLLHFHVSF